MASLAANPLRVFQADDDDENAAAAAAAAAASAASSITALLPPDTVASLHPGSPLELLSIDVVRSIACVGGSGGGSGNSGHEYDCGGGRGGGGDGGGGDDGGGGVGGETNKRSGFAAEFRMTLRNLDASAAAVLDMGAFFLARSGLRVTRAARVSVNVLGGDEDNDGGGDGGGGGGGGRSSPSRIVKLGELAFSWCPKCIGTLQFTVARG